MAPPSASPSLLPPAINLVSPPSPPEEETSSSDGPSSAPPSALPSLLPPAINLVSPPSPPEEETSSPDGRPSAPPSVLPSVLPPVANLLLPPSPPKEEQSGSDMPPSALPSVLPPVTDLVLPSPVLTPNEDLTKVDVAHDTPSNTAVPTATSIPVPATSETLQPKTETTSTENTLPDTRSTVKPSMESPSTESSSTPTKKPSLEKPSKTSDPSVSSDLSTSENIESPAPVAAPPSDSGDADGTRKTGFVIKTPPAIKSPIAIETNPDYVEEQNVSEQDVSEQDVLEQIEQIQSDVVMYDESAKPLPIENDSYDPFAIPDIIASTEAPVVLNIAGDRGKGGLDDVMTYVRGKTALSDEPGAAGTNVIGGRNTYVDTDDNEALSASAAAFHDFLRYASVAFAGISVALLLFFHFVSLDANLLWVNAAWSPNTWEFLFYVGYLQQMQAASELTLLKSPYFLWDYTDSFAWSNFLIQDSSSVSTGSRRLETIVLGGLVSYADRIGISEGSILTRSVIGFAVIMAVLLVVFLVLAVMAKRKAERALDESSDLNNYTSGVHRLRSVSIRALGLCVLVWYFALFPLSMLSSFEISMQVQASAVANALVVAIVALVLVCFGVLAVAGRVIMHKTKDELEQFENLATWGSLYCEYTYHSRMFFVIDVVVQITTGILVGTSAGDPTQLIVVMGIQALYLACVFILSPFAEQMVLRVTYALGLLKILNFGLAFAFLNSNTMSAAVRTHMAHAYVGINSIVILLWFVRQLIVFSTYIRAWMVHSNNETRRSESVIKYDPQTDAESDLWTSQFNGGLNDSRLNNHGGFNQSGATLSMPPGSSVNPSSSSSTYDLMSTQQSVAPSFGSDAQSQQQMIRKYEIGF
uniref:TRP C-terminal domain-containing protein n=1 Tax=Peronospora matthiolae TaxID=2874970 RepID=A0AAV1TI81_9STRA